jgi:hypothetical protein
MPRQEPGKRPAAGFDIKRGDFPSLPDAQGRNILEKIC